MTTYNEQEAMQGVAQRFVQAAEELHLSGGQLYRANIVANEQVLSKIKNGWQKPPRKSIDLFCQTYGVSAAWMYTGEGNMFLGGNRPVKPRMETGDEKLLYDADFNTCIGSDGQLVPDIEGKPFPSPMTGDIDFWCTNNDKSLEPIVAAGDIIALKKMSDWKEYIPGGYVCYVVTKGYKVLLKVSILQNDPDNIIFLQMDNGKPVESKISKDNIIEIYRVVFHINRL